MINIKKLLLLSFVSLIFLSCAHHSDELIVGLNELSTLYPSSNNEKLILKLNYSDVAPYLSKKGFVWEPFLLPVQKNINLTESDLLVGYIDGDKNFILPPQNGGCKLLQKVDKLNTQKRQLVSFVNARGMEKSSKGDLFLLLDSTDFAPFALLKMDENNLAHCYVPTGTYHLSYGFGSYRKDFIVNTEKNNSPIQIDFNEKNLLEIVPSLENSIQNGDMLRIGRKYVINQESNTLKDALVPAQIENDLFKPSHFQSQLIGVDETFQTTLLVGSNPFSIQLDSGKYIVAVIRKNVLVCLKEIEITKINKVNLSCLKKENTDFENKIYKENNFNLSFDATFYPERLTHELEFQKWFLPNQNFYFPILFSENDLNDKQQTFSFLFHKNSRLAAWQFPMDFTQKVNDENSSPPVFGTSLENIVMGAIPFSKWTYIQFPYTFEPENFLKSTYLTVSNGVEIKILEPFLTNNGSFSSAHEQQFRFRVSVPAWNSTNIVEMNIDGKLHRRWVLDRGNLSRAYSVTLDEKTYLDKNFQVRLTAWGEEQLPDFLYGAVEQFPYARTRDYTVNILGK